MMVSCPKLKTSKTFKLLLVALVFVFNLLSAGNAYAADLDIETFRLQNWRVKTISNGQGIESVDFFQSKKRMLRLLRTDDYLRVERAVLNCSSRRPRRFDGGRLNFLTSKPAYSNSAFINLDGKGVPNFVVSAGGNHGENYRIYSLGKNLQLVSKLDCWRSNALFIDIDHDGKYEILTYDSDFYGWETSNAESPLPQVVLRLKNGRLRLAGEFMTTPPPSKSVQIRILAKWKKACKDNLAVPDEMRTEKQKRTFTMRPIVWGTMLDLIYSGNSKLAFRLLDRFWPQNSFVDNLESGPDCKDILTSKEKFKQLFLKNLSYSVYISDLKMLNRLDPAMRAIVSMPPKLVRN